MAITATLSVNPSTVKMPDADSVTVSCTISNSGPGTVYIRPPKPSMSGGDGTLGQPSGPWPLAIANGASAVVTWGAVFFDPGTYQLGVYVQDVGNTVQAYATPVAVTVSAPDFWVPGVGPFTGDISKGSAVADGYVTQRTLGQWFGLIDGQGATFPILATGSSAPQTLAARFQGLGADVMDFGADSTGVANCMAAFQTAANYAGYRGRVRVPKGTYLLAGTVTIPMNSFGNFTLVLEPGAVINYTGSGYAFDAATAGIAYANVNIIGEGEIVGTSAGLAGIRYHAFNKGSIVGVRVRGFTNGDGIFIEGANTIDIFRAEVSNNKNGIHLRRCRDGADYGVNACRVIGGHVSNNSQWGIYDDATGTGVWGNANNYYATTFDPNGANVAGTGNIFIQGGDGHTVSSYLEYSVGPDQYGPYNIVIGDGTYHPIGTRIVGCLMATGVNANILGSIYDNGTGTLIEGNFESSTVPYLVVGGAGGSQRIVMGNSGYATAVHGGTDNGDTITIGRSSGLMNSLQPSARGLAMRSVTGQTGPFSIRKRDPADTYIAYFATDSDNRVASVKDDGGLSPGTPDGTYQNNALYMGIGAPNNAKGMNGDFYLRVDTYLISNQRIYMKTAGGWVGVL